MNELNSKASKIIKNKSKKSFTLKNNKNLEEFNLKSSKWALSSENQTDGNQEDKLHSYLLHLYKKDPSGKILAKDLHELKGKKLRCFCGDKCNYSFCYVDLLKELVEMYQS